MAPTSPGPGAGSVSEGGAASSSLQGFTAGSAVIGAVWPSRRGVVFLVREHGQRVVDLEIDGRRVWSFKEPTEPVPPELVPPGHEPHLLRYQPWPPVLERMLTGRFRLGLRTPGADPTEVLADLGGTGGPNLADVYGRPLVVNKWGRLGHTLADASAGLVDRMLDHMDEIRDLIHESTGLPVFVTGGTLLGPMRADGRLIAHDDDADLAYLSRATSPADVARENFEIGRVLREHGYEVIRLSAAHLQMHFRHDGIPDHYVDLFAGFLTGDMWYQHFPIWERAGIDRILPTTTVMVEGRPEPANRDPEFMLTALYGPGWRVPDPSFSFDLPAASADRSGAWFPDLHHQREAWDDLVLLPAPDDAPTLPPPSAFATWVDHQAPADHHLLELGCGLGQDAHALGAAGRTVRAVDFSRFAIGVAQADATAGTRPVTFEVLNLLDIRRVLRLGAELAQRPAPWTVLGRRLLNSLEEPGRRNVFRLCSMLLRRGGAAHFDLVTDDAYAVGDPAYVRPTLEQVLAEAAEHRLVLVEALPVTELVTWPGEHLHEHAQLTRMTFRWRSR